MLRCYVREHLFWGWDFFARKLAEQRIFYVGTYRKEYIIQCRQLKHSRLLIHSLFDDRNGNVKNFIVFLRVEVTALIIRHSSKKITPLKNDHDEVKHDCHIKCVYPLNIFFFKCLFQLQLYKHLDCNK